MSNVCFLSHPVYDILSWQPELRQAWLPGNIAMVVMAVNCIGIGVMENEPYISRGSPNLGFLDYRDFFFKF